MHTSYRRLPLAMLYGLVSVIASDLLFRVVELFRSVEAEPAMAKLEIELEQAKQPQKVTDNRKPVSELFGTAQARNFVAMLRGIGASGATA
jgi:hypothetical protein